MLACQASVASHRTLPAACHHGPHIGHSGQTHRTFRTSDVSVSWSGTSWPDSSAALTTLRSIFLSFQTSFSEREMPPWRLFSERTWQRMNQLPDPLDLSTFPSGHVAFRTRRYPRKNAFTRSELRTPSHFPPLPPPTRHKRAQDPLPHPRVSPSRRVRSEPGASASSPPASSCEPFLTVPRKSRSA